MVNIKSGKGQFQNFNCTNQKQNYFNVHVQKLPRLLHGSYFGSVPCPTSTKADFNARTPTENILNLWYKIMFEHTDWSTLAETYARTPTWCNKKDLQHCHVQLKKAFLTKFYCFGNMCLNPLLKFWLMSFFLAEFFGFLWEDRLAFLSRCWLEMLTSQWVWLKESLVNSPPWFARASNNFKCPIHCCLITYIYTYIRIHDFIYTWINWSLLGSYHVQLMCWDNKLT